MSSDYLWKFISIIYLQHIPYLNVSSQTVDKSKVNNLNVENNLVATNLILLVILK